jgi:fibronectin-binding autotransporter adhesin
MRNLCQTILVCILVSVAPYFGFSQTSWKGTISTSWSTAGNWTAGVPTATIDAMIGDASFTGANQPTISSTATCKSLTIGGTKTSTLTISRGLTISGNLLINANGAISQGGYSLTLKGNWQNGGVYTATSSYSNVIFAGVNQLINGPVVTHFRRLTINAGSVTTLNTNVTVSGSNSRTSVKGTLDPGTSPTYKLTGTSLTVTSNGKLKVKAGNFTDNYTSSGTVSLNSNSIVEYAATTINQVVSSAFTYSTLMISGGGVKSLAANLPALRALTSSNGNIIINGGTFDLGVYTANRATSVSGGSITVAGGAFLKIGGTNTFPTGFSTNSLEMTSTVEYNGTNQVVSSKIYGHLILSSSAGAAVKTMPASALQIKGDFTMMPGAGTSVATTAAGNMTISGYVSLGTSATFNGGNFQVEVAENWTNNGLFSGASGTVLLSGGGAVIAGAGTNNFNNLNISGNNISATTNINVAGNLATITPGTFTHAPGNTMTMSGAAKTITGAGILFSSLAVTGTISTSATIGIDGNLSVSGSFTSTGTTMMTGVANSISGIGAISFSALQVSGSVTSSSNFTISQSLDISGSFSASAGVATFTGTSTLNGTANLYSVTINGTSLVLSASSVLGIANIFTITAGNLDVISNKPNTVVFNGTGAQNINAINYHHLAFANGGVKTASAGITVNGNITIGASTTFSAGAFTHTLLGSWYNNGTFTAGTSTVQLTGTLNTSINGATTFNTLTVNKLAASVVTLNNNTGAGVVNMTTGSVKTGSNTLTITSTRNGNGIILGTITRIHAFNTGVNYAFEGPDNTVNFTSASGVTSITVRVTSGALPDYPNNAAINREYHITVPAGTYLGKLRLHYEDAELNGNDENTMQLVRNTGTGWLPSGKTGNSATTNYVEQTLLAGISNRWTIAAVPNVISWSGAASSDWNNIANWTMVSGLPGFPPGVNDIVQIGVSSFNNQPSISTPVSVKSLVFGSAKAATLTLASGGSLSTSGNISGDWTSAAAHTINLGSQSLNVGGDLSLSNGTSGHTISLAANAATVNVNGSLTQTGYAAIQFTGNTTLNIKGNFNYVNGSFAAGTGTVNFNGTTAQVIGGVNYNHLTVNKSSGIALVNNSVETTGNFTLAAGEADLNANCSFAGHVSIAAGTTLYGDGVTVNVAGNWTNAGTFAAGTGTVVFNGSSNQTIGTTTFNHLSVNKTAGTASLGGNIVINGSLSALSGTYDLGTYTSNRSAAGGVLTIANGVTLLAAGANNFPLNFASHSIGTTSTVHYNGSVAQTVAGTTYGNIIFSNGGATAKSLAATVTIMGNISINNGASLNAGAYTINLWGNWTNSGTLVPGTSTLVLNGGTKTITGNTIFNRLTVNGSYTVINNSDITYNNLLYVTPGGNYTAGGGVATLNGDLTNSGILTSSGTTTFTGNTVQTIRLVNALISTSTGVVNFNGTVSPVMNSTTTPTFANLNINNTGGVYPSKDWLVLGAMNVASGASFHGGISTHVFKGSFTNNGTVTSDGTLDFEPLNAAVNIKLSGTAFTSTGTLIFGGTNAITITGSPTSLNDVRIANVHTGGISPANGWNMAGDFIINSDAAFNANGFSYVVGGDLESNGVLNGGSSTFTMSSPTGQLTGSPSTNFNHFAITGNVTSNSDYNVAGNFTNNGVYDGSVGALIMIGGNPASINGTTTPSTIAQLFVAKTPGTIVTANVNISEVSMLFIQTGILATSTYSVTQDAGGGFLLIDDGATLRLGGTNSLPGFSGYGLDANSNVEYAGTTQSIGNAAVYGNLLITAAGTKNAIVPFATQGNFTLTNGTFTSIVSVTHSIGGNWLMTGGTFNNTNMTIVFNGTANQSISSTGAFNHLSVNKLSGMLNLIAATTVNGNLNFVSGKLSLGNSNLIMGTSSSISNANATRYIIATGEGTLNQTIPAGSNRAYPVGLANAYTPATITLAPGSTQDIIHVRMLAAPYHGGLSGDPATNHAVNATWLIGENITGGSNATVTLQWPQALELNGFNRTLCRLAHFTNARWEFGPADLVATGTNPYSVTRGGFTDFSPFAVSTFMALPVTWLSVSAGNEGANNMVNWTVASELSNDHFEIEMSTDGKQFTTIGKIAGGGTTDTEQKYSFVHYNATQPVYYYRVKQVDFDGKYSYSKVVRINTGNTGRSRLTVLNNPVQNELAIAIHAGRVINSMVAVTDVAGKVVYQRKIRLSQGNNVLDLGQFNFAAGIYYLVLTDDDGNREVVSFIRK